MARYPTRDEDNATQVGNFYRHVLSEEERTRLIDNMASNLAGAQTFIWERVVRRFVHNLHISNGNNPL